MRLIFRILLTGALAFMSCGAGKVRENVPFPPEHPIDEATVNPVIVVTLDGVRWQDVVGTEANFPNLYRWVRTEGAIIGAPGHGGVISSSGPNFVSLPGYIEIFEGRTRTGCGSNFCNGATIPTVVDEIRAQHHDPEEVAVLSSWERISVAATLSPEHLVVSSGSLVAQGHEDALLGTAETRQAYLTGLGVSAWPGHADYRPDRFTSHLALSYLKEHRPAFMFVGLGDTDEFAHKGDRSRYAQALHADDDFLGDLLTELGQMGERGRKTLVLVTADHGRANDFCDHGGDYPESARTWLFALGSAIPTRGYVSAPTAHHLADIAPTIRQYVGLPASALSDGSVLHELGL